MWGSWYKKIQYVIQSLLILTDLENPEKYWFINVVGFTNRRLRLRMLRNAVYVWMSVGCSTCMHYVAYAWKKCGARGWESRYIPMFTDFHNINLFSTQTYSMYSMRALSFDRICMLQLLMLVCMHVSWYECMVCNWKECMVMSKAIHLVYKRKIALRINRSQLCNRIHLAWNKIIFNTGTVIQQKIGFETSVYI